MKTLNVTILLLISTLLSLAQNQQIILQLQEGINIDYFANHQTSKTNLPSTFQIIPVKQLSKNLNIWLVEIPSPLNNKQQVLVELEKHPKIKAAQLNEAVSYRTSQITPNDLLYNQQWQYNNKGEFNGITDADIDAPKAWDITTGGLTATNEEIVVAVIDGGINLNHPDLINNIWINTNEIPDNNIDDDGNGFIDDLYGWNFNEHIADVSNSGYGHWHGTPVAGIIGAEGDNIEGVSGINWRVKVMSVVANQNVADVIAAYDYILSMRKRYNQSSGKQGAFVVATNASLGIDGGKPADHPMWCAMYNALGEAGILSVGATANNLYNVDLRGDLPTTCSSDFLISVTNTNRRDQLDFAAYGKRHIDLSAPGSAVFTVNNSGNYSNFDGTSSAAPHVAGTIALLYSSPLSSFMDAVHQNPAKAALLVKDCILNGTDPLFDLKNKTVSGGRLNVYKSLCNLQSYYEANTCLEDKDVGTQILYVAPNPATEIVQIAFQQNGSSFIKARLFNATGQLMKQQYIQNIDSGIHQLSFSVASLQKGIYYLLINEKNKVLSEKIMVK